jgi:predicted component of type VI protein secretion system
VRIEEGSGASLFFAKAESKWRSYQKRHEQMSAAAHETARSAVTLAFKAGYERHLHKLNGLSTIA